jgi:hypothetical protein
MTLEEAEKLCRIAETADGGCHVCVRVIVEELNEAFPQFQWAMPHKDQTQVMVWEKP